MELTKDGKPRKRAPGGGRPPKHGEQTKSVRVPVSVPTELISSIPELQAILDHWEAELTLNPPDRAKNARYWYAKQIVDEIRALGF
jgi:hypothetical protein